MRLKRIEILGFKSFGEKTVFEINDGTTAIVGPNGCGKSNVVDAIRWVLGEQSPSKLRGSNMQDIIFNGTTSLKPLGMAEVSITIEDTENKLPLDYIDIRITRRLFRTGESQYLINKKQCRLKDIQELFMDTGMSNDSYAIMAQGKIDQLLTSKPEDRRVFFEEAAGITKYKTRRNEALRKLQRTDENLTRVNDIVREIEKTIASLKIKAGKAKKYKECFERLRYLETYFTYTKTNEFRHEISALEKNSNEKEETIKRIREAIALLEKQLHKIRINLEDSDEIYKQSFENLNLINNSIEHSIQERVLNEKRIQDNLEYKGSLESEIKRLEGRVSEWHSLLEESAANEEELKQSLSEKNSLLSHKEHQVTISKEAIEESQSILQEKTSTSLQAAQEESRIKNKLIETCATINSLNSQKERIQTERASLSRMLSNTDHNLETRLKEVLSLKHSLEEEKNLKEQLHITIEETKTVLDSEERNLIDLRSKLLEKTSRLNALTVLEKNYEGFFFGIKKLMEIKNKENSPLKNIIGTISDIINVDKQHADAVEIALGNRIQNIVVEHADDATLSIEYLKSNKLGRATFLPLDLLSNSQKSSYKPQEGIIGHVLDFIRYDEKYSSVMHHLLGSYILVKDLNIATKSAKSWSGRYNFITVDGDHINASGVMTGGYLKGTLKGIISRKSEITELKQKIDEKTSELEVFQNKTKQKRIEIEDLSSRMQQCEKLFTEKRIAFHEKETEVREEKRKFESIQQNLETISSELVMIDKQTKELEKSKTDYQNMVADIQHNTSLVESELLEHKKQIEQKVNDIDVLRDAISEIRIQQTSITEKISSIKKRNIEIESNINDNQSEVSRKEAEISNLMHSDEALAGQITELNKAINEKRTKEEEIKSNISSIEQDRVRFRKEEEMMTQGIHNNNVNLQVEQEDLTKLNIHHTELEGNLSHLIESYLAKYEDVPEPIDESPLESGETIQEMEQEIEKLRKRLKYLGPVSLDAIKEYDELQERYTFLQTQQNDLHNAKVSLIKIINKLNKQAKDQFAENFEKIRQNFREIFTLLFGGGKADISLIDENDILESGIEIMAKPPGKKNQTISLLSGGEKALSSIALLFSIFKLKPSFFSVLDELDAPLDESNILRFLDLLKSFTDKTQFLIITHSKTTLKIADFIFGITMQTPGLSTTVSVNLQKKERKEKKKSADKKPKISEPMWEQETKESVPNINTVDTSRLPRTEDLVERLPEEKEEDIIISRQDDLSLTSE